MSKLWAKSKKSKLNKLVEAYTVGDDYILDLEILPYDIQGTIAHVKGLEKIGILNKTELKRILAKLRKLETQAKKGRVKIRPQDEDCHTVIENFVSKGLKKAGGKVHTGRSRNDQVLTAMRLYMKDNLKQIKKETKKLAQLFLNYAEKYQNIPMPGYSHTQQAMLSSVGHYFCAYTESLLDDIQFISSVEAMLDKNPLGSAAGFGVNILLNREFTKKELKFKNIQINSLYCQNSRGKLEALYLEALVQVMLTLSKFASDLLLFTSQEFDFFKVKDSLVTGSSIMPQKRNLDAMELLRAKTSITISNQNLVQNLIKSLPSGYHRDLQLIKKPIIDSTKIAKESLEIVALHIKGITPKQKSITAKITPEIFTADLATELAKEKKVPFRTAYKKALKLLEKTSIDPKDALKKKISLGAAGNLDINHYKNRMKKL